MSMSFDAGRSSRPAPPNDPVRHSHSRESVRKPFHGTLARSREPIPPFSDFIEVQCEDCNGTGYDFGSHKDFDPEYCPRCGGSGMELVFRDYLAETFRIVSDPQCKVALCREQIVALAIYARQTVSALFGSEPTSTIEAVDQDRGGDVRW
jgi:ribosomal protein S27E